MELKVKENKILKNSIWMLFDRVYFLFLQFFIGVKIANYYGTKINGSYALASSYAAFIILLLELPNIGVLKIFYRKDTRTVFTHLIFSIVISSLLAVFILINYDNTLFATLLCLLLISSCLSKLSSVISSYFEYRLELSKVILSMNILTTISYCVQFYVMYRNMTIIEVLCIRILENLIKFIVMSILFWKQKYDQVFQYSAFLLKHILKDSMYLWITHISFVAYTQLDKVMLGNLLGKEEVGIYSIGVSLANMTLLFIHPITVSIFPKMLRLYQKNRKEYMKKYQKFTTMITQVYLYGAIVSYVILRKVFFMVYSKEYENAIAIYGILMFAILWKANASFQTSHITIIGKTKMNFVKTLIGLMGNILLNWFLIPRYGINGAAFATVITNFITLFLLDFFIPSYREHAWIQWRSFYQIQKIF